MNFQKNENQHGHDRAAIQYRLSSRDSSGYAKDLIFGGIDGAVTTFAIVSGIAGAGMSHGAILVLGVASLLADGFSMAASNYTATKAECERLDHLTEIEQAHLRNFPEGEEAELRLILEGYGYKTHGLDAAAAAIKKKPALWIELMLLKEYGVMPSRQRPVAAAAATFVAFVICGSIPLLPFLFKLDLAILFATGFTLLVFFSVGAGKTRWTGKQWWISGFETLSIGALAAAIAYACGALLSHLVH